MNILIAVAHADDEVLGCGGAIARHVDQGDSVYLLIAADGVSSRDICSSNFTNSISRHSALEKSCQILGVKKTYELNFPDNRLDSIPLLDLVKKIEKVIMEINPEIIYTHHSGDLNVDHGVVFNAVMVASRPLPGINLNTLLTFEVVSSTEWGAGSATFKPNFFIDIDKYWPLKWEALMAYNSEMRPFPHPRSFLNIDCLSRLRGASAGMLRAEAFYLVRHTR